MTCDKCGKPIQPLGYYENIEYCRCGQIVTPEKQERPFPGNCANCGCEFSKCVRIPRMGMFGCCKDCNHPLVDVEGKIITYDHGTTEDFKNGYAQGAASRDAEVEALKAEVARFSRDANYWKWCNGCGSAKEDCEKWKDAGKVACCPECHHWPWNR